MVNEIKVKSILNKHKKRDEWFLDDYSLNPYQLCAFNCIYCYIRGSKYGENMAETLSVKINAPALLERQLRARMRKKEYGFIALSSSTEAWQQIEEKYQVTRKCLEIILRFKFPVHCLTKSLLILRDLDLLREIDKEAILPQDLKDKLNHGALITFSFSTLDEEIAKIFEPGAPTPSKRLETLKKVKDEGFYAGIAFIPVLPFISDSYEQLDEMIKTAKDVNADYVFVGALTLFGIGKKLYYKVIEKKFPDLITKYRKLFRVFSYPSKEYQARLESIAKKLCEKYNVKYQIL
ncbi:MAG: radical SAM protein [Candidatus Odinarchaeota archaeon]|nr:radical SAM protein [Candidatus Odinarchaeota archaeon]